MWLIFELLIFVIVAYIAKMLWEIGYYILWIFVFLQIIAMHYGWAWSIY